MSWNDLTRRACLTSSLLGITGLVCSSEAEEAIAPRQFGAAGDGLADDTKALQKAIDAASAVGGAVLLPAGRYRVTRTLKVPTSGKLSILGEGLATVLLHDFDGPLFTWPAGGPATRVTVRDFAVVSSGLDKSPTTPTFEFPGGLTFGLLANLMLDGSEKRLGSGIVVNGVTDTSTISNCVLWRVSGTGIRLGHGSEVRIVGGRVTGIDTRQEGNVGILLTGNNGGVHVSETDLIHLHTGLQIGSSGGPTNREVFLTHVTFDSSKYGLVQLDDAYASVIGCWAASCDESQIEVRESASGALLTVIGGTIFNGGIYGREGSGHGLVVRAGSFSLQGVNVRFNKGTGILAGKAARRYSVQGCRIHNNGTAAELGGSGFQCVGNLLFENKRGVVDLGEGTHRIADNLETA